MTTDLLIPDASYSALFAWHEDRTRVSTEDTIRRVAGPLIAAELREQAATLDRIATNATPLHDFAAAAIVLRQRADQLDSEETS